MATTAHVRDPDPLDDPASLASLDPGGMLALAGDTGRQLVEGYGLGLAAPRLPSGSGVRSVVVCGMGGSGIAGDVVRSLLAPRLGLPVVVVKGYALPEFCGRDTVVLASSFSGNTSETLSVYGEAVQRGCRVAAMSAGGELADRAAADAVAHILLPDDVPMPRAALGYLAGAPIGVLESMGLIPEAGQDLGQARLLLDALAGALGPDREVASNHAKALARWLADRVPVVWGSEGVAEVAALRWKTQVNENAKVPAFWAVLPEADHNEIEGWRAGAGFGLVILRHEGEHPEMEPRVQATMEALAGSGLEVRQVVAWGSEPIEWLFSLVMIGDFAATYLALARGVDPSPIPVLMSLKERLRG